MLRPSQVSAAACAWRRARTSSCVPATVQAPAVLQALNTQPTYPVITRVYPSAHDRKLSSMHLSSHKKQPAIESVYLGIPRNQAVACEECDSVTRAVNARCGVCKSEAITWISSVVPGHPRPPEPPAAMGIPVHARNLPEESASLFPAVLQFLSRLLLPFVQPSHKPRVQSVWEERQRAFEEMLAIPTVLRECDSFRNHPAA